MLGRPKTLVDGAKEFKGKAFGRVCREGERRLTPQGVSVNAVDSRL